MVVRSADRDEHKVPHMPWGHIYKHCICTEWGIKNVTKCVHL